MTTIKELIEPSLDAIDYRSKDKKKFFIDSYLTTSFFEKGCGSNCYYFIGEKGTGKTALAFHIQNSAPKGIGAKLVSISETQYTRFIRLKQSGKLEYTDYSIIWRATILYLMAKLLIDKRKKLIHKLSGKFSTIETAIKKYDRDSQIPELEYVIEFVKTLTESREISAAIPKAIKAGVNENESISTKTTTKEIKTALLECEQILKDGLRECKFTGDIALFIDGLDAKPSDVDFVEYQKCLSGLAEATWQLNSEYFPTIKDSQGRMRCVLLLRPDVFDSLNLHNSNCKLSDNSVLFHWHTTKEDHLNSDLYKISDKYFTAQCGSENGWRQYFQEKSEVNSQSFTQILKHSFHRPRDIFSAIKILIGINKKTGKGDESNFSIKMLESPKFKDEYSDYLLGEVKNYANYYITNAEFDSYSSFFQHLNGTMKFDYVAFCKAFNQFISSSNNQALKSNSIAASPEAFLQFWYDVNVIGYSEQIEGKDNNFYHWSLRERSPSKVMPKIKSNCNYLVHPGIAKALNLGQKFTHAIAQKSNNTSRRRGPHKPRT